MKNILKSITEYRLERGWTEYHLAELSGVPQSTISSWYRKKSVPSLSSLEKICKTFGVTVSQFLAENDDPFVVTKEQRKLLERWAHLTPKQQEVIFKLIDIM